MSKPMTPIKTQLKSIRIQLKGQKLWKRNEIHSQTSEQSKHTNRQKADMHHGWQSTGANKHAEKQTSTNHE